jgi:hypothetical protein
VHCWYVEPVLPHAVDEVQVVVGVPREWQYDWRLVAAVSQLPHEEQVNVCPSLVLYAIDWHAPFSDVVHCW